MTNEKMLKYLQEEQAHGFNYAECKKLIEEIKADILHDEAKKSKRLNPQKAALRIIKSAKTTGRPYLFGAFMEDDKQYVCDGARAVEFFEALPLPPTPDPNNPNRINVKKIIDTVQNEATTHLQLPGITYLRAYVKTNKNQFYDFGKNCPAVNPKYLLDIMEALPECTAKASRPLAPIYFEAPTGRALLFPVHKQED
ncbi:MAG: hypothetical protein IJZ63_04220 [Clostridia bacterium]|nr:hypothetical protein [Clostridia bacterium]